MQLKDYYSILELPPSASRDDIKKAYRRLALLYHPDKSEDDPYAASRFAAIKEAYEVLTNPGRKYEYLQQRWYMQSQGIKSYTGIITPDIILKKALELDRHTSRMDMHRINQTLIHEQLDNLLSAENLEQLRQFDEPALFAQLAAACRRISLLLNAERRMDILLRLKKLPAGSRAWQKMMLDEKKLLRQEKWEQKKIWLILLVVSAICLVIYFAGK